MNGHVRPITVFLLAVCGLLSGNLSYQLVRDEAVPEIPRILSPASLPELPLIPSFDPPPEELLVEINERPLFNPTRQAIAPPLEVEPPAPPPPPPQVSFVGTITQDGQQSAMVKTQTTPLAFSLRVGGTLDGWQVSEISLEHIVFVLDAARHEVKLNQAPAPQRATPERQPRRAARGRNSPPNAAPPRNARQRGRGEQSR